MKLSRDRNAASFRGHRFHCLLMAIALWLCAIANAQASGLAPNTKLRLSVIQWMPIEGEYRLWDALGGEFTVSPEGTITLPVLGAISVGEITPEALADDVASQLTTKLGLVNRPETSVQIVQYPPIYVVGAVENPGMYSFSPGLTVLQALALGGGTRRAEEQSEVSDRIRLLSELQAVEQDMVLTKARAARLQAEFSGKGEVTYAEKPQSALDEEIRKLEVSVFSERASGLTRQSQSLSELIELFKAEIGVLERRMEVLDQTIEVLNGELEGVRSLVDKGMATVSRRSDLELLLANLRADRLDQETAMMRARQGMSEAERNLLGLQDQRKTEIAQEMLAEQAKLEHLALQQTTIQRLLLASPANLEQASLADRAEPVLRFTIVRQNNNQPETLAAAEGTLLQAGDVVNVSIAEPAPARQTAAQIHDNPL